MKQENSCGMVIYRVEGGNPLFLVLLYGLGHWGFPKGHVEEGEDEHETARRELEEETGIKDVKFIPGFRHIIRYNYKAGGIIRDKKVVFFLAETKEENVKLSHEHKGHEWLDFEDALEQVTYDDEKELLKKAAEHLKSHNTSLDEYF